MPPNQYGGYDPRLVTEWVRVRIPKSGVTSLQVRSCHLILFQNYNSVSTIHCVASECDIDPGSLERPSVTNSWQACNEFESSTTEDPLCRRVMHKKSVESSNALPLAWYVGEEGSSAVILVT
ncbi:hypothetical protein TNCV_5008431 [Trichonephila clavipes]|nr:hypothetical protein TNCV_5008431 [Trichonephila clavipes]